MKLNSQTITVRDQEFEVKELTIKQLMPMLSTMREEPEAGQLELIKASVFMNGKPLGDDVESLPAGVYLEIMKAATEVNDLGGDDEGND
jgi:hypothetical protein